MPRSLAFTGAPQVYVPEPEPEPEYTPPVEEERYYDEYGEAAASQSQAGPGQVFFKHLVDGKAL